jgi:hypothetical protein
MAKGIYTPWAIAPFLLLVWGGADIYSRAELLSKVMQALWSFLLTPAGRLTIILVGIAWLALLIVRQKFLGLKGSDSGCQKAIPNA